MGNVGIQTGLLTASRALYWLLHAYESWEEATGRKDKPPSGTGDIKVDESVVPWIAADLLMSGAEEFVASALSGVPVKGAFHVVLWTEDRLSVDPEFDPVNGLAGWARRHYGNETTAADRNEARRIIERRKSLEREEHQRNRDRLGAD